MLGDCYEIKKFRLNNIVLDSLDHLNNLLFKTFLYPWYGTRKTLLVMQTVTVFFYAVILKQFIWERSQVLTCNFQGELKETVLLFSVIKWN